MNRRLSNRFSLAVGIVLSGCLASLSTMAQVTEANRSGALEEVIVTAQKREQNLQDVPIAIEAFDIGDIEKRNMRTVEDVVMQVPNTFTISSTTDDSQFTMRGIPGVALFVDGVWQKTDALLKDRSVLELERVEVLKGPQGTLYGRDTTGGAIRLETKKPAEEFGARVTGTIGNYNRRDVSINADFPIIPGTLLTKWTLASENDDGYIKSLSVDRHFAETDNTLLRADILWKPSDRLEARLILEDSEQGTTHPQVTRRVIDPEPPGVNPFGRYVPNRQFYVIAGYQFDRESHEAGYPGGEVGKFETKSNFDANDHGIVVDRQSATLNVQYAFTDNVSLTSITGYTDQLDASAVDFDSSEFQFFTLQQINNDETWTEELRLAGTHGRFEWLIGGYYWDFERKYRDITWAHTDLDLTAIFAAPECQPAVCRPFPNRDSFFGFGEEGYAVFGQVTVDLSDVVPGISLTVGARYQDEDFETWTQIPTPETIVRGDLPVAGQRIAGHYFATEGRSDVAKASFDDDTYRVALQYSPNDDLMFYYGFSQGFNGGGIERAEIPGPDGVNVDYDFAYQPEKIEQHEIGMRSDWLDNRVRANLSLFKIYWTDLQFDAQIVSPFTGELLATGTIQNVAEAESQGVEFTGAALLTDQFQVDLSVGYLDTKYTKVQENVNGLEIGDKFGQAPKWQYTIGAEWQTKLPSVDGTLSLRMDYNWTDEYNRDFAPDSQTAGVLRAAGFVPDSEYDQGSFGLLNARATYYSADGKWELSLFGTNLTDEFYTNGGNTRTITTLDFSSIGPPRQYGARIKLYFK